MQYNVYNVLMQVMYQIHYHSITASQKNIPVLIKFKSESFLYNLIYEKEFLEKDKQLQSVDCIK